MVLANLCLEAMVSAWETHGVTTYVPQAYHMPHELCARLLRLLVASKKLTAFTLSGENELPFFTVTTYLVVTHVNSF